MRTVEEVIKFCESRARQLGISKTELFKKAGCSPTLFIMAERRNTYMKIETLIELGKVLNVTVGEILGTNEEVLPDDIWHMVSMLKAISPENRRMISMNIENYFSVEKEK